MVIGVEPAMVIHRKDNKEDIKKIMLSFGIVGESEKIIDIFKKTTSIAKSDSLVLITGETGVGKELFAEVIHKLSNRKDNPFIRINCAAIPETLLESELFGYEKGAFTGANKRKLGLFEIADGGTLFLDEIGEISISVQTKLLRAIEEKKIIRVGGLDYIPINARLIVATNRELLEEVRKRNFREDLFFRINVVSIHIPPLRERKEDILPLFYYFLDMFSKRNGKVIKRVDEDYLEFLMNYPFPGNVRELSNFVERAVVLSEDGVISLDLIHDYVMSYIPKQEIHRSEREIIVSSLIKYDFNISKTAKFLGMHRNTLSRKIKKYGITLKHT
ncbi:MAG: sigma-54 dependent transcriptional regulator [Spirochaetia bacterium]|nr:sigma-54 dependent transcriptional regulator [Spirochaetota bacterium]MDW8112405.1 sigma-54 dependent transcriptional regulator [Spirochaetia bacterium]